MAEAVPKTLYLTSIAGIRKKRRKLRQGALRRHRRQILAIKCQDCLHNILATKKAQINKLTYIKRVALMGSTAPEITVSDFLNRGYGVENNAVASDVEEADDFFKEHEQLSPQARYALVTYERGVLPTYAICKHFASALGPLINNVFFTSRSIATA